MAESFNEENRDYSATTAKAFQKAEKNANTAEEIRAAMPSEEVIYGLAELFKTFGDATRAKILSCLQIRPLCVMEIAEVLNMSMSAVSHQLRVLRAAKLVKGKKEGKEVLYSLDDDHITKMMEFGISHVNEDK